MGKERVGEREREREGLKRLKLFPQQCEIQASWCMFVVNCIVNAVECMPEMIENGASA